MSAMLKPRQTACDSVKIKFFSNDNKDSNDCSFATFTQPFELLKGEVLLLEGARTNNLELMKKALEYYKVDINARNNLERTALHWAAANGHMPSIHFILSHPKADVNFADKNGMTALMWAAWHGRIVIVETLLKTGADCAIVNRQGQNSLHCAVFNGFTEVAALVIRQVDVNALSKDGLSALHMAADKGHNNVVDLLISVNCDAALRNKDGVTALHLAATKGRVQVIRKLLRCKVEVDDADVNGNSALMFAAEHGRINAVKMLLAGKADPKERNLKWLTPLMLASANGHALIVGMLLALECSIDARNLNGETALHLAVNNDHRDVVKLIVDSGCDVNIVNKSKQTSLHIAVDLGNPDIVGLLLTAGIQLNAKDNMARTALMQAARASNAGIVDMIIKHERLIYICQQTNQSLDLVINIRQRDTGGQESQQQQQQLQQQQLQQQQQDTSSQHGSVASSQKQLETDDNTLTPVENSPRSSIILSGDYDEVDIAGAASVANDSTAAASVDVCMNAGGCSPTECNVSISASQNHDQIDTISTTNSLDSRLFAVSNPTYDDVEPVPYSGFVSVHQQQQQVQQQWTSEDNIRTEVLVHRDSCADSELSARFVEGANERDSITDSELQHRLCSTSARDRGDSITDSELQLRLSSTSARDRVPSAVDNEFLPGNDPAPEETGWQKGEPIYSAVVKNTNSVTMLASDAQNSEAGSFTDDDLSDDESVIFPMLEISVQAGVCRVHETVGNKSKELSQSAGQPATSNRTASVRSRVSNHSDTKKSQTNGSIHSDNNNNDDDANDMASVTLTNDDNASNGYKMFSGTGDYGALFQENSSQRQYTSSMVSDASGRSCMEPERDPVKDSMDRAMKAILWKLAGKQLKAGDWKKLARHWKFTEQHIEAIQHHYTDERSYRNHGNRLLSIWFQCQTIYQPDTNYNPIIDLFEALVAVGQPKLAERVRSQCNQIAATAGQQHKSCIIS